jgi:uncharacterized membrane protein YdjX (TVP38/TMEM64 family)
MFRAANSRPRSAGTAASIAIALLALSALWWLVPVGHWVDASAERLRAAGAAGVAVFMAAYVAAGIAMIPGALLTLAAGYAYGPVGGLLVVWPAAVVSATVAFLIGRTLLRDPVRAMVKGMVRRMVERKLQSSASLRAPGKAVEQNSLKLMLLLRLSPIVPFNLLNYALGLSDVTIGQYVLATSIGIIPGTWMYSYLGSLAPLVLAALLARAARRALDTGFTAIEPLLSKERSTGDEPNG